MFYNLCYVKLMSKYLPLIQALLFASFLLTTFFFNRFAVDDYHFIGELRTSSFSEIYYHLYIDWHGRWTSNFLLLFFLLFNKVSFFLLAYNILSIGLLYYGIIRLFSSLNKAYKLNFDLSTRLIYSGIFLSVLFFCTISPNDTWLWYTSSIVYLWSTIAFFFGINIFFKNKRKFYDFLVLAISSVYIGGSNEPLTFFIIIALLFLLVKKKQTTISTIGLVFIGTAFLFNYFSPGTLHRDEITPNLGFIDLILYTGYSSVKYLLFSIGKTFIPALFLGIPFYLLGKKTTNIGIKFNPIKELILSNIIIIAVVILNQLIVVYALGGMSPDRSGIASSIIISAIGVRYLFLLGSHHHENQFNLKYLLIVNVVGLLVLTVYSTKTHYSYSKAIDDRIEFILQNDNETIYVKPLPYSGYIYNAEITSDANNFKNQHLKNGLGLKNDVVLIIDR